MSALTTQQKRKRLSRKPHPKPVKITDRDRDIFRMLNKLRILRTCHIMELTQASRVSMNRRLQLLYDNAYINRIDPKREDAYVINSDILYCLSAKGANVLQGRGELARPYSDPRRKAGRDHVSHTLLISDFMIATRASCARTKGRVRFIPAEEILAGSDRLTKTHPLKIEAPTKDRKGAWKINGTIPDELFGLDFTELRIKRFYFFEADRGTMPQKRKRSPNMSAIRRKYETYFEFRKRRLAPNEFGFTNFSVLFLTDSSEQRAINAREATSSVFSNCRTWLFSYKQSALAAGVDVLHAPWVRGDGETEYLERSERSRRRY